MRARLLIMDEPTSSLTDVETTQLFRVIYELRRAGSDIGFSTIYIIQKEPFGLDSRKFAQGGNDVHFEDRIVP